MNNKTRNTLKLIAILIVVLMLVMHLGYIMIPAIVAYKFWLMVIAFVMLLIASR